LECISAETAFEVFVRAAKISVEAKNPVPSKIKRSTQVGVASLPDLESMLLLPVLWVSLCAAAALSESVLRPSQLGDGLTKAPIASPELLLPSNTSVSLSNVSSPTENILKIACDSSRYGKNLKVKSCRQLFGYVKQDKRQFTFAQRDSGIPHDLPLPLRTYSGKTSISNICSEATASLNHLWCCR